MGNLKKKDEEVLPIYKRRAYNKDLIKSSNQNYMQRPMKTAYPMKHRNAWVRDNLNISGDENTNLNNQRQPIKAKASRSGRQPSDFRINKANNKLRGKTSNGARDPVKSTLVSSKVKDKNIKDESKINNRNTMTRANKTAGGWKRAQSQNNERLKVESSFVKETSSNMFEEIEKFKNEIKQDKEYESAKDEDLNESDYDKSRKYIKPPQESTEFLNADLGLAKKTNSMIKLAEAKIKATADAMLKAQEADIDLENKIKQLNDCANNNNTAPQSEDQNIQNQLDNPPMTRQERIANIVNEIVGPDDDFQEDDEESNQEENEIIHNRNTLMAFASKPLEPITENITEEIQGLYTEEGNDNTNKGPDNKYDVEKIFNSSYKKTQSRKIPIEGLEDTPMFGEKDNSDNTTNLFSHFL